MSKKVLVFGKFDILHPGHMHILNMAKKSGKVLVILESDEAILEHKKYSPYNNQKARENNLKKLGFDVFIRHTKHNEDYLISTFEPDILCLGEDQKLLQDIFSKFKNLKIEVIKFLKSNIYKSSHLKTVLEDKTAGIYLIDKPKGINSFKVVAIFRKVLNMKRVGFSGTLDPLASGLFIVATGQATKLLDWFHDLPKVYQANILFGHQSNTYDLEGEVKVNSKTIAFNKLELEKVLKKFLGKQKQTVPIYSAKKVAGKKLYDLARAGKKVKAPSKDVEIYNLKINKFKYPNLDLTVTVSAGTYIRSLAHDLGQATGTGALLSDLRRVAIGDYSIKKSLALDKVTKDSLAKYQIAPKDIIKNVNEFLVR